MGPQSRDVLAGPVRAAAQFARNATNLELIAHPATRCGAYQDPPHAELGVVQSREMSGM